MDTTINILLIVCPMAFLAGLVDSVAGGGGLISLPAYIAAGLSPHLATATNKCSSTFGAMFSAIRFMKNKKVNYLVAFTSAIAALIGSPIGAIINMAIDEKYLGYLLIIVLPIVIVFVLLKKDFGDKNTSDEMPKTKKIILAVIIGFTIGMYDGFFGPGTGTFLIFAYTTLMGFDLVTASGNTKIVNLASNVAAFITFAISGKILWGIGLPAALFNIAGNWIGAGLALKNGKKIIQPMFFIALTLLMGKILFDMVF